MEELMTTKLQASDHLILEQPLLRLPFERCRRNFRTAQRLVEKERENLMASLKACMSASAHEKSSENTIKSIDSMIMKMRGLKRKLEPLREEEVQLHRNSEARLQHLQDLHNIPSLVDVKYEEWSRIRLNRFLVDHMLRMGFGKAATQLAEDKNIQDLVDLKEFAECHEIRQSLLDKKVSKCLTWCQDNKNALRKMNSNLEAELRLQQFIELVRPGDTEKTLEATRHARKYMTAGGNPALTIQAAGLLAFPADTEVEPYKDLYSPERWSHLADLFVMTHHNLFSLPVRPLLQIALSAGLSSLKTPSCHSIHNPQVHADKNVSGTGAPSPFAQSTNGSLCPICSPELNELARNVPYAHHSKSYMETDPVLLPSGRVYGMQKLQSISDKVGTPKGFVRDPGDLSQKIQEKDLRKVFIS